MTRNEKLFDAVSQLQAMAMMTAKSKDEAYGVYWQAADLGWALMQATGIAAVTREQFEKKQNELFETGWKMIGNTSEWLDKCVADSWPSVIE